MILIVEDKGDIKMTKIGAQYTSTTPVNHAEPCKVAKGMPRLAGYGLLREAATVEISPEGSKKAAAYANNAALENQEKIYDSEEVVEAEKSFDDLMDAALNGGALGKEEQERFEAEMFNRINRHYSEMSNLRLADNDERLLEEMKKNFLMKQQALKDMRQVAADEAQQEEAAQQEAEAAQNADKIANKAAEADMIAKSMEGLDQENDAEPAAYKEASAGSMSGTAGDKAVSGEEKAADHRKTMNYDTNNQENIDEIDRQRIAEAMQEKEYSRMLDESYERTLQVFENKEFTLKERAEAYNVFIEESRELAENREIAKHLKIYDYESVVDLRLKALSSHGKKNSAAQVQGEDVQDTGRHFVKDAAADKRKAAKDRMELLTPKAVIDDREDKGENRL